MFPSNNPWQSYRKVAVQTASPAQLVLMLYDGIIKFLEKSLTGFEMRDPLQFNQTVNNNIIRAQAIINELNTRLDMNHGEVSDNFRRLYNYFNRRLAQSNLKKDKAPVVEVLGHIRGIRDSWAEMIQQGKATTETPSAAADLQPA